jgi:hypothetical protein
MVLRSALPAQTKAVTRIDIIRAEDSRGKGPEGIEPILAGLRDPALRETAIRAIGRLERPDLVQHIVRYLDDPAMRATKAEALAQALRGRSGSRAIPESSNSYTTSCAAWRRLKATVSRGES